MGWFAFCVHQKKTHQNSQHISLVWLAPSLCTVGVIKDLNVDISKDLDQNADVQANPGQHWVVYISFYASRVKPFVPSVTFLGPMQIV